MFEVKTLFFPTSGFLQLTPALVCGDGLQEGGPVLLLTECDTRGCSLGFPVKVCREGQSRHHLEDRRVQSLSPGALIREIATQLTVGQCGRYSLRKDREMFGAGVLAVEVNPAKPGAPSSRQV